MKKSTSGRDRRPRRTRPWRRYRRLPFSGLTGRILAINVLGLAVLVGGILYVNQYRSGLLESRLSALQSQAEMLADALGETATGGPETTSVDVEQTSALLRRLLKSQNSRVRIFLLDGTLAVDTRELLPATQVVTERLRAPGSSPPESLKDYWEDIQNWIISRVAPDPDYPLYEERYDQVASDYPVVVAAFRGRTGAVVRLKEENCYMLTVAVPIQRLRRVLGAVMVSVETTEIEEVVRQERFAILEMFVIALAVTVLLSLFLAGTIARPVRRLAAYAHNVRLGSSPKSELPDFSSRMDEGGDLSRALTEMTNALYRRIDTIEAFAADVSHEIKNPLTSLRSAIETMERTDNPDHRTRLMEIVKDDVRRLDRLISDISNASRLDAEMLRSVMEPISVPRMLTAITGIYDSTGDGTRPRIELTIEDQGLAVYGLESHLGQVIRNLIDNAISFSPENGMIRVAARSGRDGVVIVVEDDGPGVPEDKREKIFDRFYSERPESQGFGNHSGLGLNICREIIAVHNGTVRAENRYGPRGVDGPCLGARFVITMPAIDPRRVREAGDER